VKIFVVDDCRESADLVVEILRTLGYEVAAAYDGVQGLEALSVTPVDVVLLDLRMPGMDGYHVLKTLRSRQLNPQPRIVAFTGCADANEIAKMQEYGFDSILIKPVSIDAIAEAIDIGAVVS